MTPEIYGAIALLLVYDDSKRMHRGGSTNGWLFAAFCCVLWPISIPLNFFLHVFCDDRADPLFPKNWAGARVDDDDQGEQC